MRPATAKLLPLLVLAATVHHHGHLHGRDAVIVYLTLALGSFESWAGVPGPGESLLIAAGILAGKGHLDLAYVLLTAFGAATVGGIVGWVFGVHAGRRVIEAPGPLLRWRQRVLEQGEEIFARYPPIAIYMAPSWISGIHHVRPAVYLPWNAICTLCWALGIGLASYFIGPPVVHFIAEEGAIAGGIFVVLIVAGVILTWWRRRRLYASEDGPGGGAG